jgi:branched-chain amino acid transport system ATP-binding protein
LAPDALVMDAIDVRYGAIHAVQGASVRVARGQVTALVGSNGAGKSSLLKAAAGLVPYGGKVTVNDRELGTTPARVRVVDHGIVLVPEGRSVLLTMTVRENLELGLRVGRKRVEKGAFALDDVWTLFPVLRERESKRAQYLSGGEKQMLAIARSLLMTPTVLLIDEPSMGLAPLLVKKIFEVMAAVFAATEMSVLLVEQDTAVALELATDAYLLEHGQVVLAAPASEMREDPRLRASYLGARPAPIPPGSGG